MIAAFRHTIRSLVLFGILLAALAIGWMVYFARSPLSLPQAPYQFTLKQGSSLRGVARQLSHEGLLREPWSFILLVKLAGKPGELKAGNYELPSGITPLQLLNKITRGDVSQSEISFIEGWTFKQMRKALDDNPLIKHETTGLPDAEVLRRLEMQEPIAEGLFFPDTYYFSAGMSDLSILRRARQLMMVRLNEAWKERESGLPYATPYQALIMASIVEKETGQASERPLIAAVFINRLRIGMRLQTDPTVIYGLGDAFDGNLRKSDLLADNAYNSYTRAGLPPSPIAMPSSGAIQAVLHPARSSALYFVSKGDGTHQFSATLAEHNRAVARYQKN